MLKSECAPPPAIAARPGLGVITFADNGGGVAYVARLLRRVLVEAADDAWLVELGVERRDAPRVTQRAAFAARALAGTLSKRAEWMVFNHVGIARVEGTLPRLLRVPYGVFVHDVEAWETDIDGDRLRTLTDAAVVIANSEYTTRRLRAARGDAVRVVACPLGLMEPSDHSGVPDGELIGLCHPMSVLIVGRMMSDERYKGHDELLAAWPSVRARVPEARLIAAGWGDDIPRLRETAASLGLGDAVVFPGYVDGATLAELFKRAAVYAMPSAREGFGLVYLEAMRSGVPCIGSSLDAASEVIAHNESGFIVDRGSPRELADALVALLTDPDLRGRMGEAGRKRFAENFTFAHFRSRLLPILANAFPGPVAVRGA